MKLQKSLSAGTFPSHHIPTLFRVESEGRSYAQLVPQRESQEAAASSSWSPARTPTAPARMLGRGASGASTAAGGPDGASRALRCLPGAGALGQH